MLITKTTGDLKKKKKKSPVKASKDSLNCLLLRRVGQREVSHQRGKVGSIPFSSPFACEETLLQYVLCHTVLSTALVTQREVIRSPLLHCPQLQIHINMWETNSLCHTPSSGRRVGPRKSDGTKLNICIHSGCGARLDSEARSLSTTPPPPRGPARRTHYLPAYLSPNYAAEGAHS